MAGRNPETAEPRADACQVLDELRERENVGGCSVTRELTLVQEGDAVFGEEGLELHGFVLRDSYGGDGGRRLIGVGWWGWELGAHLRWLRAQSSGVRLNA
jgi:hypothetical protein